MTRNIIFTKRFRRDLKRSVKQGKNEQKLLDVVEMLANDMQLAIKYRDHSLQGDFVDCRECHIEPDWLLVYRLYDDGDDLFLKLEATGSHSDLFE